jgi:hypothetical protein
VVAAIDSTRLFDLPANSAWCSPNASVSRFRDDISVFAGTERTTFVDQGCEPVAGHEREIAAMRRLEKRLMDLADRY